MNNFFPFFLKKKKVIICLLQQNGTLNHHRLQDLSVIPSDPNVSASGIISMVPALVSDYMI